MTRILGIAISVGTFYPNNIEYTWTTHTHAHRERAKERESSVSMFLDKIDVTMSVLLTNAKKHIISRPACTDHLQVLPFTSPTLLSINISINSHYHPR